MAVTIKTYQWLRSYGDQPDFTNVNNEASSGWELLQVMAFRPGDEAQWFYVMQRSAGQTTTDVLVGQFTASVSDNRITLGSHGLSNGDLVRFAPGTEPANELPAPLVEGVYYFVVNARINDFMVSLIAGGSAVDITTAGVGATNEVWRKA